MGMKEIRSPCVSVLRQFCLRQFWEGPYLVKTVLPKGAARISDLEGNEFMEPVNLDRLKKYYL